MVPRSLSRKGGAIAAAVIVLLGCAAYRAPRAVAAPIARWEWRNPLPQGNDLNAVAYGSGVFVAVGEYGAVVTSHDGLNWRLRDSGTQASLVGVAHGDGRFVAVGCEENGRGVILVSHDGVEWSGCTCPDGVGWLAGVAFGSGRFVAVGRTTAEAVAKNATEAKADGSSGEQGVVLVSPDGLQWSRAASLPGMTPTGIAFEGGRFAAEGAGGVVAESRDGLSWSVREGGPAIEVRMAARGGGRLVTVGKAGSILYSNDGLSWYQALKGSTQRIRDAAFGAGVFVAVGDWGTVHVSTDGGSTWTVASLGPEWSLMRVGYGNGRFVALGHDGLRTAAFISRDSLIWSGPYVIDGIDPSQPEFSSMVYAGGKFVVVECVGGSLIESVDGADWVVKRGRFAGVRVRDIAAGDGILAAVGRAEPPAEIAVGAGAAKRLTVGVVLMSSDGEHWEAREHPAVPELRCVAYGQDGDADGRFVAAGDGGVTLAWGRGPEWSVGRIGADAAGASAVTYGGGWFVVAGTDGRIFASRDSLDAIAWGEITPGGGWRCSRLAFGTGRFIAVGDGGTIFTGSIEENAWPSRSAGNRGGRPAPD